MTDIAPRYRRCVGIMLLNTDGLVWVGRRIDYPGDLEGDWTGWCQMPQGGIDGDEDPRDAAFRELHEETGVRSAEIIAEAPEWLDYDFPENVMSRGEGHGFRGQTQKWFAMRMTGPESEIDIDAPAGQKAEFDEWRWVPMADLPGLIVPFKRKVYEELIKVFGDLAAA
ncbi:MAG: RNA pyrophosphohydrolase [Pseudomonadota bacterium]